MTPHPETETTGHPADSMSGYKVTVTRTLHLVGRYYSRESAEEFGRGLADSGQLAPGDWETAVTAEPLDSEQAKSWHDGWTFASRDGDGNLILRYEESGGLYKVLPVEEC